MFGWREVFTSFSMTDFAKAREALGQKGIRYYYKSKSLMRNTRGSMGSFGIDVNYAFQYYLYVKKDSLEEAQYLIGNAFRR